MNETLMSALIGIVVSAGLFALGVWAYPRLKREKQHYPFEAQIEAALLPIIYDAILAAYRVSERAMDEVGKCLAGADKKVIADGVYALLPDKVGPFDITLVKRIVTRERFRELVQDVFDGFDRFYVQFQGHFEDAFEAWQEGDG